MNIAVICGHLESYRPLADYTVHVNKVDYCKRHGYTLYIPQEIHPDYDDEKSHASGFSWSRMEYLLWLIGRGKHDWIWTVGADTLVTNFTVKLEDIISEALTVKAETTPLPAFHPIDGSPAPAPVIHWAPPEDHKWTGKKHLLICGERATPIQADSFIMRSSPESAEYLRDILAQYPLYKHHPWVENQAMIDLREKHAAITHIVPQWRMNAYDYSRFWHYHPCYRDGIDCYGNRGEWQKGDFLIHWAGTDMERRRQDLRKYKRMIVFK